MKFVTDEDSKKEYKTFLEEHERCNFQQSLEWAEIKKPNWKQFGFFIIFFYFGSYLS